MAERKRRWPFVVGAFIVLLALSFVPEGVAEPADAGAREPFVWDQDERWTALEARFDDARERGCAELGPTVDAGFAGLTEAVVALEEAEPGQRGPDDTAWTDVEDRLFGLAPSLGACTDRVRDYVALFTRVRRVAKDHSTAWDLETAAARDRLYRLLYGGRMAVEELLLQLPEADVDPITRGTDEPSVAPSTEVHGVRVHSGDILISRGGAPTSALIARGNDYPGNFSHVALLHVAEDGTPSIVESHIETGVVVSTLETYLEDTKLRIMVLRLRADLPALRDEPLLAHRAAEIALEGARAGHIPYDFEMDYTDPEEQFCSEVASSAYRERGVALWEGLTSMSARGVVRWLASFGVRHFETHGPSDLEYDPKLRVVAEWREPETLFQDHLDNAVVDAMLERAEEGDELSPDVSLLPLARAAKAYSVVLNWFGGVGPVPEGMSATVALRAETLRERHAAIADRAGVLARGFEEERGYRPPYWELVRLARQAQADVEGD